MRRISGFLRANARAIVVGAACLTLAGSVAAQAAATSSSVRIRDGATANLAAVDASGALKVAVSNFPSQQPQQSYPHLARISLLEEPVVLAEGQTWSGSTVTVQGSSVYIWWKTTTGKVNCSMVWEAPRFSRAESGVVGCSYGTRSTGLRMTAYSDATHIEFTNAEPTPATITAAWLFVRGAECNNC